MPVVAWSSCYPTQQTDPPLDTAFAVDVVVVVVRLLVVVHLLETCLLDHRLQEVARHEAVKVLAAADHTQAVVAAQPKERTLVACVAAWIVVVVVVEEPFLQHQLHPLV